MFWFDYMNVVMAARNSDFRSDIAAIVYKPQVLTWKKLLPEFRHVFTGLKFHSAESVFWRKAAARRSQPLQANICRGGNNPKRLKGCHQLGDVFEKSGFHIVGLLTLYVSDQLGIHQLFQAKAGLFVKKY